MKTIFKSILLILPAMLMTGCLGLHQLTVTPTVTLDKGNFKFVRYVEAEEESIYILGIGGMGAGQAGKNAYSKLVEKAHLKKNQAIANVSYRRNNNMYFPMGFFYTRVTTVVSGWVVEFYDENGSFAQVSDSLDIDDAPILTVDSLTRADGSLAPGNLEGEVDAEQGVTYESDHFCWTTQNPEVDILEVYYDKGNSVIVLSDESYANEKLTIRTVEGDEYVVKATKRAHYVPGVGSVEDGGCKIELKNCDLVFPFSIIHSSDPKKTIVNISLNN